MHGHFTWYELTTPDVNASNKFYPRFTKWGTQAFDKDYAMWTTGGVPVAGIFQLTAEMSARGIPPNWMPYVETDNVDDTAARAVSLGGLVMQGPMDVSGAGRIAVLQDPQGAVFGVYKSNAASQGWDGTPILGRFSWHELMTTDYEKAFEFYQALFGWEKTGTMDMGDGSMYLMFGRGEKMYGGIYNRMPGMESMPPFWLCYIHVKDVKKAVAAATAAGATLHRGPMDIPGGAIAILGDPQGAAFAVHHENAAVAAPPAKPEKTAKATAGAAKATKAKSKAAVKPLAKSKPETAVKAKGRSKSVAKSVVKAKAKSKAVVKPKAKSKAVVKPKAKSKTVVKAKAKAGVKSKARPKAAVKSKAKPKAAVKSKARSAAKKKVKSTRSKTKARARSKPAARRKIASRARRFRRR